MGSDGEYYGGPVGQIGQTGKGDLPPKATGLCLMTFPLVSYGQGRV